jgi:hypothetical protein
MPITTGQVNANAGFELFFSNFEAFENVFYTPMYDKIHWTKVIPEASVEFDIADGASSASYGVKDWAGRGEFRRDLDGDVPTVGMNVSKPVEVPILDAGVAAYVDRTDMRTYQFAYGGKLDAELPQVMRWASDRHIETTFFYGYAPGNFEPWMDYSGVTAVQAAQNEAATSRAWADKTGDEILIDINTAINTIWSGTRENHTPGMIALPSAQYAQLATKRLLDQNLTVLQFVKENNLYSSVTGQPLQIIPIPHLDGAGAGGTQRMVVWEHDAKNFKMPFPIPHTLLAPQLVGYKINLLAEYKFGSFHVRYPASMIYMDEI